VLADGDQALGEADGVPSPLVVGVIAVMSTSRPRRVGNRSSASRRILAVWRP
jgi:hypothetical protein